MKPEIEDTDIIIRRAANGWIVFSGSEYEEGHFITTVYEESDAKWGEHETLIHLFHEHFPELTQSKKQGGIKLEVRERGYAFEEDEEDERGLMYNTMTKDKPSEQNIDQKKWVVKIEHLDAIDPDRGVGELCIRFPDELVEQLGWEIGDEIEWEETEICEDWGEHKGLTLGNKSKLFRGADEARKKAVSIDME